MILNKFYEALMARIVENIKDVKHFDLYFGQDIPNEEGEMDPFPRPAVFMKFAPMDWESMGSKVQAANATFSLIILDDVVQEFDKNTAPAIRNLGHKHLELLDKVNFWIHGFSGAGFNTISRTGLDPYQPNGQIMGHEMKFKTRLTDDSAVHKLIKKTPSQKITVTIPEE